MADAPRVSNFLSQIIEADVSAGLNGGRVVTRFPPEPNGFLHIGHAKSIFLNFGLASQFGGRTHLRFDDTNPTTEDVSYVESILADVAWLGCSWGEHLHYASDYFDRMYDCAERLVSEGKAYVDSQPQDAIREQRGSFAEPGQNSPHRDRPPAESLALLRLMRAGEFPDGACVLRARIDMAHPNVLMRDPLLYRIRHAHHHRTGDRWCIYPMYDFAHPLEDAFEGVTHSICTLEFESNRELYDWVLDALGPWDPRPRQYEFARLAMGYTVLSKRKLLQLVSEKRVSGWDDPRMPTLAGLRRRGVTPEALRDFAELIGVAKNNSVVDIGKFEYAIRSDLEKRAPRAMAVLDPLPVLVENWPVDRGVEDLEIPWWPGEPTRGGTRKVPFGRELLIERDDFALEPPAGWKRLAPGREVRLAGAYLLRCEGVERDATGKVERLRCSYDPDSLAANATGRRASGTLHWLHAPSSVAAEIRLYDRLFHAERPDAEHDLMALLNPGSLTLARDARIEPALTSAEPGSRHQFLRQGYFFVDPVDSRPGAPVFNRTISLKDTWAARASRPDTLPRTPSPGKRAAGAESDGAAVRTRSEGEEATAPGRKSRPQPRHEVRMVDPALQDSFERYRDRLGLSEEQAALLSGDAATARYFDAALGTHSNARSIARWLVNELLGLARERGIAALPLSGAGFGRFVALLDSGKLSPASGKTLLASLAAEGGEPEARMKELRLEKVSDRTQVEAAVERALEAHGAELARYLAGEKKLFGVLLGAAMRQLQGAADAATIRQILKERLGRQGVP